MLKINMEYRKGILFVRLKGWLNEITINDFDKVLTDFIQKQGIKYIVFNLQKLERMDIYGKRGLVKILKMVKDNQGLGYLCGKRIINDECFNYLDNELKVYSLIQV